MRIHPIGFVWQINGEGEDEDADLAGNLTKVRRSISSSLFEETKLRKISFKSSARLV